MIQKLKLTSLLLLLTIGGLAQNYIGHVTLLKKNSLIVFIGGGASNPGSTAKQNASLLNGLNLSGNVFVPIVAKRILVTIKMGGSKGKTKFTSGINTGVEYFSSNKDYNISPYKVYNIQGQSSIPTISARGTGSPKAQGFKYEAGPQMNIILGNVVISPIVNAGYISLKQRAFVVTQSGPTDSSGQKPPYNLFSQSETKTNGFCLTPKLRLSYFFGRMGFWVEGSYATGPTIHNETFTLLPKGSPNQSGNYTISQMEQGTQVKSSGNTKYKSSGFSIGLNLSFGGSTGAMKKSMPNEPWDTLVPGGPWLNSKTGQVKYFEYMEDYVINDPSFCNNFGVKQIVIAPGKYKVNRNSSEESGTIILTLKEPIPITKMQCCVKIHGSEKEFVSLDTYDPRGKNCKGFGNNCFYVTAPLNANDIKDQLIITTIIEKEQVTKLQISKKHDYVGHVTLLR